MLFRVIIIVTLFTQYAFADVIEFKSKSIDYIASVKLQEVSLNSKYINLKSNKSCSKHLRVNLQRQFLKNKKRIIQNEDKTKTFEVKIDNKTRYIDKSTKLAAFLYKLPSTLKSIIAFEKTKCP